ncbi:hypothetical protein QW060_07705 [Myroides ceti]|uniref:N-acetyltransferase domain-containing protein n=1 Tax=Paenimyroides ceti TaxID=395087 RepID=A0ABT8CVE9_9FLAO|nr:hypothetical protein [Paenimyroides ceti]MDN3707019.1 hypothetical protein [Paenimyroides ceti]
MLIKEVDSQEMVKQFLHFPVQLYKNDKNWIRPLDKDIEEVFDQKKNKTFQNGGLIKRWLLFDGQQQPIGRIAAFINPQYKEQQPTGGIGFFECIDDQKAAHCLFDTAKKWLQENKMEAMDGPINFGERDKWWGLLVQGFHEPLYNMNYNFPYYQELFESYGFKNYFDQECYALPIDSKLSNRIKYAHERVARNSDYHAEYLKKNQLEKYIGDFLTIYNAAWETHGGGKQLTLEQAKNIFYSMKPIIEEKIVWFVYHNERPVAFWLNIPDLNQYFKKLNGKFGLIQKLKFLYLQKFTKNNRIVGVVFGVVPDFQGKGVEAYMIVEGTKVINRDLPYTEYEMQWIGDFNPKMIRVAQALGAERSRKLTTYRYLFDPSQPFERHRVL